MIQWWAASQVVVPVTGKTETWQQSSSCWCWVRLWPLLHHLCLSDMYRYGTLLFYTLVCTIVFNHISAKVAEEVKIEVLYRPENCPVKSKRGDALNAHYDGYLEDGTQIYCSRTSNDGHPKWFVLGAGQVIKGLDIGMDDMCEGEKRKVTIPPSLAFGAIAREKIPPNSILIFEIELYAVRRGPRSVESFRIIDLDGDKKLSRDELKLYLQDEFKRDSRIKDSAHKDRVLTDIFLKNDQDGDGYISAREYNVLQHDEL